MNGLLSITLALLGAGPAEAEATVPNDPDFAQVGTAHPTAPLAEAETAVRDDRPTVLVVIGAAGTDEYGEEFARWAGRWEQAATRGEAEFIQIDNTSETGREQLQKALAEVEPGGYSEFWLVLIGHGTFDGRTARFNLRGPDLSAEELNEWLMPFTRPLAVINCASASGPFINRLSAPDRVIVTATKSGHEQNYARFGDYLSQAISDIEADLDKDGQTSLLEAWLIASGKTDEFYRTEGRLATEHSLLDDNGDGLGTRSDFYEGIRPVKSASEGGSVDGYRANLFHLVKSEFERSLPPEIRRRRDELELAVIKHRLQKESFSEDEYFQRLEELLLPLAELYESLETPQAPLRTAQQFPLRPEAPDLPTY